MKMEESTTWSANANRAITILLVRPRSDGHAPFRQFRPAFTYSIFGEKQVIFGYQHLSIVIRFAAFDLRPQLEVRASAIHSSVEDGGPLDVRHILREWLPPVAFKRLDRFNFYMKSQARTTAWTPPGELISTYQNDGKTLEIWCQGLDDPAMQEIITNMQIFTPFFIEGGTYIGDNEPEWSRQRWTVFLLYEKLDSHVPGPPYSIIGYCTTHRFYHFVPSKEKAVVRSMEDPAMYTETIDIIDLPCRERISQFLILRPYQYRGHGSLFYNHLIDHFMADTTVDEITVEDPNERFDDLRDFCDLGRLRQSQDFSQLRIDVSVPVVSGQGILPVRKLLPVDELDRLRAEFKMADRQFDRLVEMQLLSHVLETALKGSRETRPRLGRDADTASPDERYYYLWRLIVKRRLTKRNLDTLAQLELAERLPKLEEATNDLEMDYFRILAAFEQAARADRKKALEAAGRGTVDESMEAESEQGEMETTPSTRTRDDQSVVLLPDDEMTRIDLTNEDDEDGDISMDESRSDIPIDTVLSSSDRDHPIILSDSDDRDRDDDQPPTKKFRRE